nr:protein C13B9.2 [imported] - Caenorhabditis elegans [Caenorhabditis elegans]
MESFTLTNLPQITPPLFLSRISGSMYALLYTIFDKCETRPREICWSGWKGHMTGRTLIARIRLEIAKCKPGTSIRCFVPMDIFDDFFTRICYRNVVHMTKGCSIALIISDVIGNPVELIASGPTVIPAHQQDKFIISNILESLKINKLELPVNVKNVLENHEKEQLPENTSRFQNFIISSNNFALRAAAEYLTSSGYNSTIVTSSLSGNAAEIGKKFAEIITEKSITSSHLLKNSNLTIENYPIALLFGGETTVHLSENPGKGGRNQEMVLSCLDALKTRVPAHNFTFLSAGTDGQDGPTDAAGAIISNEDLPLNSLLNSSEFLQNSDSYNFWRQFKGGANHILTGPSGTNVMDIQILLLDQL